MMSMTPSSLFDLGAGGDSMYLDVIPTSNISAPASPTAPLEVADKRSEQQQQQQLSSGDVISNGNNNIINNKSFKQQRRLSLSSTTKTTAKETNDQRRVVTFDADAKQHDGLCERSQVMDSMIKRYFVEQKEVSELDVIDICHRQLDKVKHLHEDLNDLSERLEEASAKSQLDQTQMGPGNPFLCGGIRGVPVLPQGGGMCSKLNVVHLPYVKILNNVVHASINRLANAKAPKAS